MAESQPNLSNEALTKGYEPGDLRVRWFVVAVICFVAFAAVTYWWLWVLVKTDANVRRADQPLSAVPEYGRWDAVKETAPPLQPTPYHDRLPQQDLAAMRQREDKVFAALGWKVDGATHRMTPPEDLVQLVVARYARASGTAPATAPAGGATTQVVTPIPGVDQGGTR